MSWSCPELENFTGNTWLFKRRKRSHISERRKIKSYFREKEKSPTGSNNLCQTGQHEVLTVAVEITSSQS